MNFASTGFVILQFSKESDKVASHDSPYARRRCSTGYSKGGFF